MRDLICLLPWLTEFFETGSGRWTGWMKLKRLVRDTIRFQRFNLLDNAAAFGNFDVIFCRNVMLYFGQDTQEGIVNRMTERAGIPAVSVNRPHRESGWVYVYGLKYVQPAAYQRAS